MDASFFDQPNYAFKLGPGPSTPIGQALDYLLGMAGIAPATHAASALNLALKGNWQDALPEGAAAAAGMAPLALGIGSIGGAAEQAAEAATGGIPAATLASRWPMLYAPPVKPPRPFAADYPAGAPSDAAGRLTADIDGNPLIARNVVGRQEAGGADVALSPAQVQSVGEGSVGAVYSSPPAGAFRRNVYGRYNPVDQTIALRPIEQPSFDRVLQHETAHLIDEVAGQIPTDGIVRQLRQVFNTMNTGQERTRHLTGPEQFGYRPDMVPRELMGEAIRAYMADPNYLKTVAPDVAARIRAAVNTNSRLSPWIQFNSIVPFGLGGAYLAADPQQ